MRARTRARLFHIALVAAALAIGEWFLPIKDAWFDVIKVLLLAGTFALFIVWTLSEPISPFRAPDVLGERLGLEAGYDAHGLTVVPNFTVIDGLCWIDVFYQNRLTSGCRANVFIVPMEGVSRDGRSPHEVPPVTAEIECRGGEVGVVSYPLPIVATWQGRIMIFDVYAITRFSDAQGEQIRPQRGARIDGPNQQTASLLATVAMLPLGILFIPGGGGKAGKIELRLPKGVSDAVPPGVGPRRAILWEMDLPTGGFPVSSANRD